MAKKKSPRRVRQRPLEPIAPASQPGTGKPLFEPVFESKHQPEPLALSDRDRIEASRARKQAEADDNAAAEARPSQLTPKQLKRLAVSEAKKAALGGADVESRSTEQLAKKRKLTPPKPKPDKTMALANKLARERRLAAKRNRPSS